MFDSDNLAALAPPLTNGAIVATYADIITPAFATEFKGRLVVIDRGHGDPLNLASVADMETGALSIAEGVAKIRQWEAEGRPFPTGYVNRAEWPAFDHALGTTHAFHWVATLDGTLLPDGKRPDVVQFAGEAALGFHADASLVWNAGWHPIRPYVDWVRQQKLAALGTTLMAASTQVEAIARSLA